MMPSNSGFGLSLLLTGIALGLLVWGSLHLLARRSLRLGTNPPVTPVESERTDEGVLVIQAGGRVGYLNAPLREWMGLRPGEPPNLEQMASTARPAEEFLELCVTPGQRRLNINGHPLEVASTQVPGSQPQMLLTFRDLPLDAFAAAEGADAAAPSSMQRIVADFAASINRHLGLDSFILAVLENLLRLLPADIVELDIPEHPAGSRVVYRLGGAGDESPSLARSSHSWFGSLGLAVLESRQSLILPDPAAVQAAVGDREQRLPRSYMSIPLVAGDQVVGLLEAGCTTTGTLGRPELGLAELLAPHIASGLRNSLLFEQERRRVAELSSLVGLGQAVDVLRNPEDLFGRLLDAVAPLTDARILGFLLYDEDRQVLEAQNPFQGLPPYLVGMFRAHIVSGSPAESLLQSQQPIIAENAAADDRWRSLGLAEFAAAASLRDSALIPLVASRRLQGFLEISNRADHPGRWNESELDLFRLIGGQLAAIIENSRLVGESQQRALRSRALEQLTAALSQARTSNEALLASVNAVSAVLAADLGLAYLLEESRGELRLHTQSSLGVSEELMASAPAIAVDDPGFPHTVTSSRLPYVAGRASLAPDLPSFYRSTFGALQVESVLVVPLVARGLVFGELQIASRAPESFTPADLEWLSAAGALLAGTLDRLRLESATDAALRSRVDKLTSISRIGREFASAQSLVDLLNLIHTESIQAANAACGSVALIEPDPGSAGFRGLTSVGDEGDSQLAPLELRALVDAKEIAVPDFSARPDVVAPHKGVQSALYVPIVAAGTPIGLLQVHSLQGHAFDQASLDTLGALAVHAGAALTNMRRIQAARQQAELLRRRASTLQRFSEVNSALDAGMSLETSLGRLAAGIQGSTPFRLVLISVYEPETGLLRRVAGAGIEPAALEELQGRKQQLSSVQQLTRPEFKISRSFFIPADQTPILPDEVHYAYASQYAPADTRQAAWNPDDSLLLPLEDAGGTPLGLISLDNPSDGLRPDRAAIESVELFAAQAVQLILNARRAGDLQSQVDALTSGLSRQQQLLEVTQSDLPVLLRKDLEQTMALHALDRRARRVRAGLSITEAVGRQLDVSSALLALARETLVQFGMSAALVAENSADGPRLSQVLGNVPSTINLEALFGQRNPLRSSLQTGAPILVSNVEDSEEWRDTPVLSQLRAKGFISLPVLMDNRPVAAMLAISPDPLPPLTEEERQVYQQISRQASVVLQNITLLNETRHRLHEVNILLEFSRTLGGLDPGEIVQALLKSARHALSAAHAGLVLLWNPRTEALEAQAASGYADDETMLRIAYRSGQGLPGMVFAAGAPRRVDEVDFARDYALPAAELGQYRLATGGRLPVASMLLPILVEDKGIGLVVLDNFNTVAAFTAQDEALVMSLAQQAALSLENVRLVSALTERAGQLQGLNEAALAVASGLRSDELIASLLDQVGLVLPFDAAALWVRDLDAFSVVAAQGFPDGEKRLGSSVALADSPLFQELQSTGQPLVVGDVRGDPRFPLVEAPRLSWLGIPMLSKGNLIGLITLEAWQASFYGEEQVRLGATLASQAAATLENARLYEASLQHAAELDQRSERLAVLNRFSAALSGLLDAAQVLSLTADELRGALRAARVAVVTMDPSGPSWVVSSPRAAKHLPQSLPAASFFRRMKESPGVFITEDSGSEAELAPLKSFLGRVSQSLLVLPVVLGSELLALLFVSGPGAGAGSSAELEMGRTIANQAAIALQNARLYESTLRAAQQLTVLNQSTAEIGSSLDPDEIYGSVQRAAARLMPVDSFLITLLDLETQQVEAVHLTDRDRALPLRAVPLGRGLGSRVIQSGAPMLLEDSQQIIELDGESLTDEPVPLCGIAVPMTVGHRTIGMLSARSHQPNAYTSEDLGLLAALANQAVSTIQNGRLFAETQRLAQEFEQRVVDRTAELRREQQSTETLLRILTEVSASLDLDRALNRTLSLLNEVVRADQGTIMLLSPDDALLHYRAGFGYLSDRTGRSERGLTLKVGEGLAGWVVQNREAALVDDLRRDPRWMSSASSSRQHRSAVVAPLMVADDVIGALMVFSRRESYFTGESLTLIKAIANQVAVAINNARLYELIRDQADRLGAMLRKEQEEASRSQAILESVADGVLVTSFDNRVSFVNASVQLILGSQAEGLVGQPLEAFGRLFGEPGQAWIAAIRRWSENPTLYAAGETYAERIELSNNRIALIHLAPVILEDDFLGTVSILRDITREVEVDRLKSEFVATVSHELRTPMTAIKGYVEMLMMGAVGAVNENQAHFLEIVRNNIDRLNTLVGDLLDVSRIESGKVELAPEELSLEAVVREAAADLQQEIERDKKPMSVSIKAPKSLPPIVADRERLLQILHTLLDNAYHYTPENGAITISLKHMARLSAIQVEVSDNGVGIAPADQERVFERFFRGENPMVLATPGTGLGLSIARQLVEMHGGRITVKSEGVEGQGSTFSFTLPLRVAADAAPEDVKPTPAARKKRTTRAAPLEAGSE